MIFTARRTGSSKLGFPWQHAWLMGWTRPSGSPRPDPCLWEARVEGKQAYLGGSSMLLGKRNRNTRGMSVAQRSEPPAALGSASSTPDSYHSFKACVCESPSVLGILPKASRVRGMNTTHIIRLVFYMMKTVPRPFRSSRVGWGWTNNPWLPNTIGCSPYTSLSLQTGLGPPHPPSGPSCLSSNNHLSG